MSCDALTISKRFALEGEPVDAKPYGAAISTIPIASAAGGRGIPSGGISSSG